MTNHRRSLTPDEFSGGPCLLGHTLWHGTGPAPLDSAAVGGTVWSVCGAFLFGIGAVYWAALYIAKRRRDGV